MHLMLVFSFLTKILLRLNVNGKASTISLKMFKAAIYAVFVFLLKLKLKKRMSYHILPANI